MQIYANILKFTAIGEPIFQQGRGVKTVELLYDNDITLFSPHIEVLLFYCVSFQEPPDQDTNKEYETILTILNTKINLAQDFTFSA